MNIVLTTRNFPPLVGGMERLIFHVHKAFQQFSDVFLIGPSGCCDCLENNKGCTQISLHPLLLFLIKNSVATAWTSFIKSPKLVFGGSGLTAPSAFFGSRLCGGKCAAYLHGLDLVVDNWLYRRLFLPIIRKLDFCIVNSRAVRDIALSLGVDERRIRVLNPGVGSLPAVTPEMVSTFENSFCIKGKKLLLCVGRLTRRKGISQFISHSLPDILKRHPDTCFMIVGDNPGQALNQGRFNYREQLEAQVDSAGLRDNVLFVRTLTDAELACAYSRADVLVFPVIEMQGDIEGFGMVAVEAASLGCPTVAFSVGGVVDAVMDGASGRLVCPGHYAEFSEAVGDVLEKKEMRASAQQFSEGFVWSQFNMKLEKIIREELGE